jgi:ADP-ribose pyrophosphatase YjhB (NUDIX family)
LIRFCSSFSAIARSCSTARARRAYVAQSASCWTASRVPDEGLDAAALRELQEETAVDAGAGHLE